MNVPAACGEASRRASLLAVFAWRFVRETRSVEPEDMPD